MAHPSLFPALDIFLSNAVWRICGAMLSSAFVTLFLMPWVIRYLRARKVAQVIRAEGPITHHTKKGTPTMGGVAVLAIITLTTLAWTENLTNPMLWLVLGNMVAFGLLGLADDVVKWLRRHSQGIRGSIKLILSIGIVSIDIGVLAAYAPQTLFIPAPTLSDAWITSPFVVVPFLFVVILGTANAANLTDGLDGLLSGTLFLVLCVMGFFSLIAAHPTSALWAGLVPSPYAWDLAVWCACAMGGVLAFLWTNGYPASIFLGDSGALGLGAAVAVLAIIIKQEWILCVCGGIWVVEAISVITQVGSFKLFRRRILRMAPLHHHFEMLGWHENQIIVRFWIISILLAMISVGLVL